MSASSRAASPEARRARQLRQAEAHRAKLIELGKRFITGAVEGSFALGKGLGPVGHFWRVRDWPA